MTDDFTVRPYRAADETAVVALWETAFGYPEKRNRPKAVIEAYLRHGHGGLLVATDGDGHLVGTIVAGYDGHRGWLYRTAVLPSHRRQGVGRALATAALAHLKQLGCAKVNLQLHGNNDGARAFWRRVGFADEVRVSMGRDLTTDTRHDADPGC